MHQPHFFSVSDVVSFHGHGSPHLLLLSPRDTGDNSKCIRTFFLMENEGHLDRRTPDLWPTRTEIVYEVTTPLRDKTIE